jgi:hypothetical protein
MSKQHLDAFAVATGLLEGVRLGERSSHVAGVLVDVAQDPASRHVRAALWLERASPADRYGCDVAHRMVGADRACCHQNLACRADVDFAAIIGAARLKAVTSLAPSPAVVHPIDGLVFSFERRQ